MTRIKLGDVLRVKHGYAFSGEGFGHNSSLPQVLTPGNFSSGDRFKANLKSFNGLIPEGYVLNGGDVVVTMTDLSRRVDTLGLSSVVPDGGKFLHNQRIGRIELLEPSAISLSYFHYVTRTAGYRNYVVSTATGTTVRHTSPGRIESYELDVPNLRVQQSVANMLGSLDDKVDSNKRVVRSLESLRKQIWMRASRGAAELPLSSHAQFVNGGAFTKGATGAGRVVIRISELNNGIGSSTVYNDLYVPDKQVARAGDLLMSWSGSLAAVRWYRDDAIINQHIFKVIPNGDTHVWAVACAVETKLDQFREIAAGKATTMGHIKRADLDAPVSWPEISDRLNDVGKALWDRALAAEKENQILVATRDALLPLLMSGKITVKDAEKTVEEVV